jgi:pimeloyl-ACP methyl ester carboxylesterase
MLEVSASEWEKSEVFALDLMKQRVEQVYLAGFSMGGALALSAAAGDEEISGVILMSPALKLTPLASIAGVHRLLSWAFARAKWLDVLLDDDPFRYQSFSLNGVVQVDKVVDRMRERVRLLGVSAPVYIAASWEDRTVDMPGGFAFIGQHIPAYAGRLYYQSSAPTKADLLASHGLASAVDAGRLELVDSTAFDPAILGFSHLSVQLSPANIYYGKEGRVRNCHYYFHADFAGYQQCKRGLADFQGELNRKTLERGLIQRLSYNPDWDGMWQSIDRFLAQAELGSLQ